MGRAMGQAVLVSEHRRCGDGRRHYVRQKLADASAGRHAAATKEPTDEDTLSSSNASPPLAVTRGRHRAPVRRKNGPLPHLPRARRLA